MPLDAIGLRRNDTINPEGFIYDRNFNLIDANGSWEQQILQLERVIFNPAIRDDMSPLFFDYLGDAVTTREGLRYYFARSKLIFDLLQMKKRRVLDIGCGFGLTPICFSLLGAGECIGIDISDELHEAFRNLVDKLRLNIEARHGDFLETLFPQNSFDRITIIEAISHIRDTDCLLDKIADVLRPGGILYVSDGNNSLFLCSLVTARMKWRRSEFGPIPAKMSRHGRQVDRLCFRKARERIVQELWPSVDEKTRAFLAKRTQGMYGEEIAEAVKKFRIEGTVTGKASFPYRNPYTGEFPERDFNPWTLMKKIEKRGFMCKLIPPIESGLGFVPTSSALRLKIGTLVLNGAKRCPAQILPFVYPTFTIIAEKRA